MTLNQIGPRVSSVSRVELLEIVLSGGRLKSQKSSWKNRRQSKRRSRKQPRKKRISPGKKGI